MSERIIVVTENRGDYKINESDFNGFELLGLLEQIVFDLKNSSSGKTKTAEKTERPALSESEREAAAPKISAAAGEKAAAPENSTGEPGTVLPVSSEAANELRTRIGKAVKAIRDLGGKIETAAHDQMSEADLQTELEALTNQYKRLKGSASKK